MPIKLKKDGAWVEFVSGTLNTNSTTADVFDIGSGVFSADDPGADRIIMWDNSAGKLDHLALGNGLSINDVGSPEISATGTANFSVPGSDKQVLFNDGSYLGAASTLEYTKTGSGTLTKIGNYIRCQDTTNTNHVDITSDGGVEIKRTSDANGPYLDFKSTGGDADARIQMESTVGANFSSIVFTTGGESSTSERLRIGKAGQLGIAGANYGTTGQVITSGGASGSVTWGDGSGLANSVPAGTIVMYKNATAPSGWVLCDNSAEAVAAGAPDLRDRFIVSTGSAYSYGDTGGANSVTLTEAQMPSHDHDADASVTDPGHRHQLKGGVDDADSGNYISAGDKQDNLNTGAMNDATTGITVSVDVDNEGGGTSHENRPPYYALTFIMKT